MNWEMSEQVNREMLVKQTVQALKPYKNRLGMCTFVSVKIYSYTVVGDPWKLMQPLKSPWKMVTMFCVNSDTFLIILSWLLRDKTKVLLFTFPWFNWLQPLSVNLSPDITNFGCQGEESVLELC